MNNLLGKCFPGGRSLIAAAVIGLGSSHALAADTASDARIRELEKKLEKSMQMIEALQSKVSTLEAGKAQAAQAPQTVAAAPANAQQAARIEALEQQVAQLGSGISNRSGGDVGVPFHGFADVGLSSSGERNPSKRGKSGFNVGSFDMYLTPQFGDNVRTLLEVIFEVDANGDLAVDMERVQLGYTFSDAVTLWAGRFHTPYGYWNTAFHHGSQIQTSVMRPRFLDFEDKGGILPAHATGAWATGTFNFSAAKLGYDVYAANASRIRFDGAATSGVLNMEMGGASGNHIMSGFNLWATPKALSALRVGLHGLSGRVTAERQDNPTAARLNMLGGYAVYNDDNWEILGEYYAFRNRNRDDSGDAATHNSSAWYTQAGYNFGRVTPFARYEKTSLNQADNYFALQENGRSYKRAAVGVRYDLTNTAALKLELNRTRKEQLGDGIANNSFNEAYLQYAVRF